MMYGVEKEIKWVGGLGKNEIHPSVNSMEACIDGWLNGWIDR